VGSEHGLVPPLAGEEKPSMNGGITQTAGIVTQKRARQGALLREWLQMAPALAARRAKDMRVGRAVLPQVPGHKIQNNQKRDAEERKEHVRAATLNGGRSGATEGGKQGRQFRPRGKELVLLSLHSLNVVGGHRDIQFVFFVCLKKKCRSSEMPAVPA